MSLSPSEHSLVMAVLERGPVARQELLKSLDLSAPSLTRLSKRFLDLGVFTEIKNMDAFQDLSLPVGRPPKGYVINPEHGHILGFKLTGRNVYGVLTDLQGTELQALQVPLDSARPEHVVQVLIEATESLRTPGLRGVGISLGGSVAEDGTVLRAPFLGWNNVDLKAWLEEAMNVPVTMENDVVALAEGLRLFGVAKQEPNFALVTIGAGIGHALVVRGQVVKPTENGLGLGGHIPLYDGGSCCEMGHRGCSQAMLTMGSMTAQFAVLEGREVTYQELLDLAAEGDDAAWTIVKASARALGRMLAMSANMSTFNVVVLGGEGTGLWQVSEEEILHELQRYRDPEAEPVQVLVDENGFDSWAQGASAVALLEYLKGL